MDSRNCHITFFITAATERCDVAATVGVLAVFTAAGVVSGTGSRAPVLKLQYAAVSSTYQTNRPTF